MVTEERPWGSFTVLADEPDHKVKRLVINPGHQISYQYHFLRTEYWLLIAGMIDVGIDGKHFLDQPPGSTFVVRPEQRHRIKSVGKEPAVIIEVQTGEYFGEDDIIRLGDDYGRA